MRKTGCDIAPRRIALAALVVLAHFVFAPAAGAAAENLAGFYARDGNDGSPAETAGNNIYVKFFPDRWLGMLFIPYPYATGVDAATVDKVFTAARAKTTSAAYLRNRFGLLDEAATAQIERYGYLGDRIAFDCGALSACTIRIGDGYLELIKPGVINEHIVRYRHVALP